MAYLHGISLTEIGAGGRALRTVTTAIIGLIATGPAADATLFPLDRPVLITDISAAIGKAGDTGTLKGALQAIADQAKPILVVVRVAPGVDAAATTAAVVGTTDGNGQKTGMQALLAAEAQLGFKPRIIGAPGLDTLGVTTALAIVAKKLRAMAYASAIGANVAAAIAYRANFAARELMLITPDFKATSPVDGTTVTSFAVARALGLRAKIDAESGWNKMLSNVAVEGVTGITKAQSSRTWPGAMASPQRSRRISPALPSPRSPKAARATWRCCAGWGASMTRWRPSNKDAAVRQGGRWNHRQRQSPAGRDGSADATATATATASRSAMRRAASPPHGMTARARRSRPSPSARPRVRSIWRSPMPARPRRAGQRPPNRAALPAIR